MKTVGNKETKMLLSVVHSLMLQSQVKDLLIVPNFMKIDPRSSKTSSIKNRVSTGAKDG